ncbi:MAG: TVP38/TMEM64 family protein [Clostridia bacterium]|nr:TVP38/TMEM64 family protein [Clostridia bacterium]
MNKWLKLSLIILLFASISIALFFILRAFNITDIETLKELINKSGKYAIVVFIAIQVIMLVCFCFVPLNSLLIVTGIVLFGPKTAFVACLIAICFSSTILFFLGDKFGEKLAVKLIGKKELEKVQNLIDTKSKILLPISFLVPAFPDEAFCIIAGMTKMKYWYFISLNIFFHIIEIGTICFFGSSLIDWSALSVIDWVVIANLIIIDIYLLYKLEKFIDNRAKNKKINDKM